MAAMKRPQSLSDPRSALCCATSDLARGLAERWMGDIQERADICLRVERVGQQSWPDSFASACHVLTIREF
jgi:hypothetical protein